MANPTELRLDRATQTLRLAFDDGTALALTAEFLRTHSPSAEVQGHGGGEMILVPGKRHVKIVGLEPVGHYAVRIIFDDGHDSGIFSWTGLREMAARHDALWARYVERLATEGLSRE